MIHPKPKVTTILQGGLGNRLFQLAAGWSYAKKHGLQFVLKPMCILNNAHTDTHTHNTTNAGNQTADLPPDTLFSHFAMDTTPLREPVQQITEDLKLVGKYIPLPDPHGNGDIVLNGYFQHYRYIHDEFKLMFSAPPPSVVQRLRPYMETCFLPNVCFLHIRRGDYMEVNAYRNFVEYRKRALNLVHRSCEVLVFSDEPEAVYREIEPLGDILDFLPPSSLSSLSSLSSPPSTPVLLSSTSSTSSAKPIGFTNKTQKLKYTVVKHLDEQASLWLMTLCGWGGICTNSTFGWWGAYLNQHNARRRMIVPRPWFLHQEHTGMAPPGTVQLSDPAAGTTAATPRVTPVYSHIYGDEVAIKQIVKSWYDIGRHKPGAVIELAACDGRISLRLANACWPRPLHCANCTPSTFDMNMKQSTVGNYIKIIMDDENAGAEEEEEEKKREEDRIVAFLSKFTEISYCLIEPNYTNKIKCLARLVTARGGVVVMITPSSTTGIVKCHLADGFRRFDAYPSLLFYSIIQ